MKFNGDVVIAAPQAAVWDYLTDPSKVTQCAPGVQSVAVLSPEKFKVVAGIGFGMVKVTFDNMVTWSELTAPNKATAKIHGDAAGSAMDATGTMTLSPAAGGGTTLHWEAEITILGQVAALASRLMSPMAKQLTGAFFACVRKNVEAP